jgi:hypothetical protein
VRAFRVIVAIAALVAVVAALATPVSAVTSLLMAAFALLPLLIVHPTGVAIREDDKTRYVLRQSSVISADAFIRLLAAAGWLGAMTQLGRNGSSEPMTFTLLLSVIALCGLPLRLVERASRTTSIIIDADAVTIFGPSGTRVVRFQDLREVRLVGTEVTLLGGAEIVGFSAHGVAAGIAARRIVRAIEHAHGVWTARDRARGSPVEDRLRRAEGQDFASWLKELDALSIADRAHRAAYRDDAGLDEDALWQTLERQEATPEVRAAAARILGRTSEGRVRVAECVRVVDDDRTRAALEASQKSYEEAAAELEALDAEALARDVGR